MSKLTDKWGEEKGKERSVERIWDGLLLPTTQINLAERTGRRQFGETKRRMGKYKEHILPPVPKIANYLIDLGEENSIEGKEFEKDVKIPKNHFNKKRTQFSMEHLIEKGPCSFNSEGQCTFTKIDYPFDRRGKIDRTNAF